MKPGPSQDPIIRALIRASKFHNIGWNVVRLRIQNGRPVDRIFGPKTRARGSFRVRQHVDATIACAHQDQSPRTRGACTSCYRVWYRRTVLSQASFTPRTKTWHNSHFGFDAQSHTRLLNVAGGRCEACGSTRRLCIDHDHATLCVRGVLCDTCNRTLGLIEQNPAALDGILAYLNESKLGPRATVLAAGLIDAKVPARRSRKLRSPHAPSLIR